MNKKLQVFISSTFKDLEDERQAAVEAVLKAGHIPAGMELFMLPMQHNVRKLTVNSVRNMLVVLTKKEEKQS